MKKLVSLIVVSMLVVPAFAAPSARGRPAMATNMIMAAPRATASVNQLTAMSGPVGALKGDASNDASQPEVEPEKDMREAEKAACLNNNIGVGNTFVWASRLSNVASYHSMIEDVENPQNNTCFVRVEMRSNDSRISVDDIPFKYFEMGTPVECGSWVDESMMRQRILDGKKSARVWSTVAASVGGAGLGVGIMELFGNKLIGGKVEGQVALQDNDVALLRSQLLTLKDKNPTQYRDFILDLQTIIRLCDAWDGDLTLKPDACDKVPGYTMIVSTVDPIN